MNFNKAIIAGHMTRDPETRQAGEHTVCNFGLASSRKRAGGEEVLFIDCTAWNKTAEIIQQYCNKGSAILVEGHLRLEKWDDKTTGAKRSKITLTVESFQFGGGPKGDQQDAVPAEAPGATPGAQMAEIPEDEMPF
jgi:single-strand DNA-binding protein